MIDILQIVLTAVTAVAASSGFWAYMQRRADKNDAKTAMLIGLGHDRIMDLGIRYVERGSITQDEYENFIVYLWEPYEKLGGNGSAKRIMQEVQKLEIKPACYERS